VGLDLDVVAPSLLFVAGTFALDLDGWDFLAVTSIVLMGGGAERDLDGSVVFGGALEELDWDGGVLFVRGSFFLVDADVVELSCAGSPAGFFFASAVGLGGSTIFEFGG
jgi:hypothetical protein